LATWSVSARPVIVFKPADPEAKGIIERGTQRGRPRPVRRLQTGLGDDAVQQHPRRCPEAQFRHDTGERAER
jgi:hypothetical protein